MATSAHLQRLTWLLTHDLMSKSLDNAVSVNLDVRFTQFLLCLLLVSYICFPGRFSYAVSVFEKHNLVNHN